MIKVLIELFLKIVIEMDSNGHSFLDRVIAILKEEASDQVPLINFKHPKELEVRKKCVQIEINIDLLSIQNIFDNLCNTYQVKS